MVADQLNAAADPRARLLRKRRWALRLGLFFRFAMRVLGAGDGSAGDVEHAGVGTAHHRR